MSNQVLAAATAAAPKERLAARTIRDGYVACSKTVLASPNWPGSQRDAVHDGQLAALSEALGAATQHSLGSGPLRKLITKCQ